MTVQAYMGDRIENAGKLLAHFVQTTAPDRRDWVPQVDGAAPLRTVLDQASECVHVNRMLAALLRDGTPPDRHPGEAPRPFATDDEACAALIDSARELGDAVRALDDAGLAREYPIMGRQMVCYDLIELPYRNMQYHGGQINLVQLLYGDAVFHIPGRPNPAEAKE